MTAVALKKSWFETVQFVSENQDRFLDMILLAFKSVDARNNQSFPTDFLKVTMARYLAHYSAVSSAKHVVAISQGR